MAPPKPMALDTDPDIHLRLCSICGRVFPTREHMLRHERTHTAPRPHKCLHCEKSFGRKDVLTRHVNTIHRALLLTSNSTPPVPVASTSRSVSNPSVPPSQIIIPRKSNRSSDSISNPSYSSPTLSTSHQPVFSQDSSTEPSPPSHPQLQSTLTAPLLPTPDTGPVSPILDHPYIAANPTQNLLNLATLPWVDSNQYQPFFGDLLANFPEDFDPSIWNLFGSPVEESPTSTQITSPAVSIISAVVQFVHDHIKDFDIIDQLWPKLTDPMSAVEDRYTRHGSGTIDPSATWTNVRNELINPIVLDAIEPPSSAFLSTTLNLYFRHVHIKMPFLHQPTFVPSEHSPLLLLAMCASGARFVGTEDGHDFAQKVFERIDMLLQRHWAKNVGRDRLDLLRVALLLQTYAVFSGDSQMLATALAVEGGLIANARHLGLFAPDGPCFMPTFDTLPLDDPVALENLWRNWIKVEKMRRMVALMFHIENFHHDLIRDQIPPSMPLNSLVAWLPAQDYLFQARDAQTWAELARMTLASPQPIITDLVGELYQDGEPTMSTDPAQALDSFSLWYLLDATHIHDRSRGLAILNIGGAQHVVDGAGIHALYNFRTFYLEPSRERAIEEQDQRSLANIEQIDLAWHGRILFHGFDFDLLEVACGRNGAIKAAEAFDRLGTDWLWTPLTRRLLLHAGHILQVSRQAVAWSSPHLTVFTVVFQAMLFAYVWSYLVSIQLHRPKRSTGACTKPVSLTEPQDWESLGTIGLQAANPTPAMETANSMSEAERFIHFGGSCTAFDFGLLSSDNCRVQLLLEVADVLSMLSINGRPIGAVFSTILRKHAMM